MERDKSEIEGELIKIKEYWGDLLGRCDEAKYWRGVSNALKWVLNPDFGHPITFNLKSKA